MIKFFYSKTLRYMLTAVVFFATTNCWAQGCDETVFTDLSRLGFKGNPFNENFLVRQIGDNIYAIKTGNSSSRIRDIGSLDTLWVYNITTNKINFILISSKGIKSKYSTDSGKDFYVDGSSFYILNYRSIHIYKKEGNRFSYSAYIKPKYSYSYFLGKIGEHLILYEGYNYHPLDQKEQVIISKFSTKSYEIVKSIYPKMNGIEFTHSNKRFCAIHKNTILFSQPFSDTISIYNSDLEQVGRIKLKNTIDDTVNVNYKEFSTDEIQRVLMDDYLYNRNIKISVVGDTLLVLYKKKFQNFRGSVWMDVYTNTNEKWVITDTAKYVSFSFDSTKMVTPTTWYPPYIIDNNQIMTYNGYMYEVINKFIECKDPTEYNQFNYLIDKAFSESTFKAALIKQPLGCLFSH